MALEIFRLVGSVFVDTDKANESLKKTDKNAEGIGKKFLRRERQRAYDAAITPDCRHGCAGCGANCLLKEVACDA